MRAESYSFSEALSHAVNDFAAGTAPSFLKPFVAGGVSIALEKSDSSSSSSLWGPHSSAGGEVFLRGGEG